MTLDRTLGGYWASPWPGEDSGPSRRQQPRALHGAGHGLALAPGEELRAHSRQDFAFGMVVLREPGEVFVFGHTMGGVTTSWVERIDPDSLMATERSPDLPGGPFWAGGLAAHANGSLYVTYGRWCHRLAPDCTLLASRELPRDRPYNSLVILPDGHLVMKDFAGGDGVHALPPGMFGSELVVLEPDGLEIVDRLELDQGSISRLSAGVDVDDGVPFVHVVGDRDALRITWDELGHCLSLDSRDRVPYRTIEGQTFGWDPVLTADSAWFLDNGEGSTNFGPSFRGKGGASSAPLHLIRAPLDRGAGGPQYLTVCDEPGGLIANPPIVDDERHIAVGYDSAHGVMRAWRYGAPGTEEELWSRAQDHASHCILYGDTGEVITADFDHDAGVDVVVVLDIETGTEKARVATGSPLQSVLFPCPGWDRDFYVVSFTTLTHVVVA